MLRSDKEGVLQCVAMCCNVLQWVAVGCSVMQCFAEECCDEIKRVCWSVLEWLQCGAVGFSVVQELQCVAGESCVATGVGMLRQSCTCWMMVTGNQR